MGENRVMNYNELPLLYGRLNPEIEKGFEKIVSNIQPMMYVPIESLKSQLSDIKWQYEITAKIIDPESDIEIGTAVVTILKKYDEKNHENSYKLIDYKEQ